MVKYGVLFEVRTGFLNTIYTSFSFKEFIILNPRFAAAGPRQIFTGPRTFTDKGIFFLKTTEKT
jgi:hypothetical protein